MLIRQMKPEDLEEIIELLALEGYPPERDMMPANTYVWDENGIMGFFYFKIEQNIPSLRNFVIKKEFRNVGNGRKLANYYLDIIKKMGFTHTLVTVKYDYLCKIIEKEKNVKPYGKNGDDYGYLVEVA